MFRFEKPKDRDFVILNLTDVQLCECQWDKSHPDYDNAYDILDHTVRTLIERVKPDLITVTGDISSCDQVKSYPAFGRYLDQFEIPWCVVWGNHDQQDGIEFVYGVVEDYRANCKYFFHEDGDSALGNGNYLIGICKEGQPIHTLFMMDSHNCVYLPDENGQPQFYYDRLNDAQIVWYKEQAKALKEQGCSHSSMFLHIPIHAYWDAWYAAFDQSVDPLSVDPQKSLGASCWNKGYEDAFGVRYEECGISAYPYDDGVLTAVKEAGITQNIIAGHDHVNNFFIPYQGVNLIFATNTGKGCYWNKKLNGGTVFSIGEDGAAKVRHEYVDVTHLLREYDN